ncbi:chloride channel protein 2-like [Drosophila tropicalis]|uniref:chloride channel protein 2-like n=1 Tax=Drosophila tropicalis TaxID=46794 RepID=UPI0035ABD4FE
MESEPIVASSSSSALRPRIQSAQPNGKDNRHEIDNHPDEGFGYTHTLMYGRYSKDLQEFAGEEARKLRQLAKLRKQEDKQRSKELLGYQPSRFSRITTWLWQKCSNHLGKDWIFLTILGIIMAFLAFAIDECINTCIKARLWLYRDVSSDPYIQYIAWISLPICLILFAAGFVHLVAPQSGGSGIPEMKTILRGVLIKDFLTFKTLVAKVVGLTAVLGSGMPLGKEGPFVHIASIVAQLLSKMATPFRGIYENESRNSEMLAAACALGLGACFAAPIGAVLFSIEVTTTYFAVRNYWRGFFACVVGASFVRLLAVWFQGQETVHALFPTTITTEFPYDTQELMFFGLTGVLCGLMGAGFVWVHRHYVLFMRSSKTLNMFLQKNRFIYPGFIALIISTLTFPLGTGQFLGGQLSSDEQLSDLFSNFTWTSAHLSLEQAEIVSHWSTKYSSVFVNLTCYTLFHFFFSIIASTMAVPHGMFIPALKIGSGFGRLVGEFVAWSFPQGIRYGGGCVSAIMPGAYAIVGAAAFSGSVTHSISVAVVVFEITGQIAFVVPVLLAVLIANAVASWLQPSMYESVIMIKKLPYLPDLLSIGSEDSYLKYVEDFMVREVKYIWHGISYQRLKDLLKTNKMLRSLPLVDSPDNMILLGSVQRSELIRLIERHIGRERRLEVAQQWHHDDEQQQRQQQQNQMEQERRPSRFEVTPTASDVLALRQRANEAMLPANKRSELIESRKSILKKTNSLNLKTDNEISSPQSPSTSGYLSNTSNSESRLRSALQSIFKKSSELDNDVESGENYGKRVHLPADRVVDMSPEAQQHWEAEQMAQSIDFSHSQVGIQIDPSPFQLVERTSLLKVHSLFSMMGVNHAYVTKIGRLVGVVSLKELRKTIEDLNNQNFNEEEQQQQQQPNLEPLDMVQSTEVKPLLDEHPTSDEEPASSANQSAVNEVKVGLIEALEEGSAKQNAK